MRVVSLLLVCLGMSAAVAQGWPTLPTTGFISGRAATDKDVAYGDAIFVLRSRDIPIGTPLNIMIPQYAYLVAEGDKKKPMIVVQAEEANGIRLMGVRDFRGKKYIAKDTDLEFLGAKPPD